MKTMTTGLYNVALGQINLNICTIGSYNVAIGYNAMNYSVNSYNSISIGSGAGYNISASDNICIGNNTGTDTVNGYSRPVCIGYGSKFRNPTKYLSVQRIVRLIFWVQCQQVVR